MIAVATKVKTINIQPVIVIKKQEYMTKADILASIEVIEYSKAEKRKYLSCFRKLRGTYYRVIFASAAIGIIRFNKDKYSVTDEWRQFIYDENAHAKWDAFLIPPYYYDRELAIDCIVKTYMKRYGPFHVG